MSTTAILCTLGVLWVAFVVALYRSCLPVSPAKRKARAEREFTAWLETADARRLNVSERRTQICLKHGVDPYQ